MTPTGTNLLGLVKHLAYIEFGYFGEVFRRETTDDVSWLDDAEDNADMWATADETREEILALYRRAWAHTDAAIAELPLGAPGTVPWWSEENRHVTLERIIVHVLAETSRHAGHADVVRETIDGQSGLSRRNDNLPAGDTAWWVRYRERLERAAEEADRRRPA